MEKFWRNLWRIIYIPIVIALMAGGIYLLFTGGGTSGPDDDPWVTRGDM